jgi:hypothetical protein
LAIPIRLNLLELGPLREGTIEFALFGKEIISKWVEYSSRMGVEGEQHKK